MAMSAPEVFVDEPRLEKFMIFHSGLGATRRGGLLWRCGACVGEPVLTRWHGCVCVWNTWHPAHRTHRKLVVGDSVVGSASNPRSSVHTKSVMRLG